MRIYNKILVVLTACCIHFSPTPAFGQSDNKVYPPEVFDKSYDFIFGRISNTAIVEGKNVPSTVTYDVAVIADLRNSIKVDSMVRIYGYRDITFNINKSIPDLQDGSDVVLFVKLTSDPRTFQYEVAPFAPLGFDFGKPISPADVNDAKAAFAELAAAVGVPGGAGPSNARVGELLKENNFYLWAFAVWRLSQAPENFDRVKRLFTQQGVTPRKILWLDDMFSDTGSFMELPAARLALVRSALQVCVRDVAKLRDNAERPARK